MEYLHADARQLWNIAKIVNKGGPKLALLELANLRTVEVERGESPFESTADVDGYERFPAFDGKWYAPIYRQLSYSTDIYSLDLYGYDLARAWVSEACPGAGETYGCGSLTGDVRAIDLIEVDGTYGYQGVGTEFLRLLVETNPLATWIAYSKTDAFWDSTGWDRFENVNGDDNWPLYILSPDSRS